jgi:hypothetical protein
MSQLFIIDPGFTTGNGHHYFMNRFITREAETQGYEVLTLAHQRCDATLDFPYKNFFRRSPYYLGDSADENLRSFLATNQMSKEDLIKGFPSGQLNNGATLLLHSAHPTFLVGFAGWLKELRREDLRICIVLRAPGHRRHQNPDIGNALFGYALRQLEDAPGDIRIFVDSKGLLEYCTDLCWRSDPPGPQAYARSKFEFGLTPIGIDFSESLRFTNRPSTEGRGIRYIFAGVMRDEKGGNLIPKAIENHLKKYPQDSFGIQVLGGRKCLPEKVVQTKAPNIVYMPEVPNVLYVLGPLVGRQYYNFLQSGDVILIPYSPTEYNLRTSHIFMESLGIGRAVVTTADTWMEEQLHEWSIPHGRLMQEMTVEELVLAMATTREKIGLILSTLETVAPKIRERHNAKEWVKLMLEPS